METTHDVLVANSDTLTPAAKITQAFTNARQG